MMKSTYSLLGSARKLLLVAGALCMFLAGPGYAVEKQVVGWVERARIHPGGVTIRAKLDTGAKHSSLNVSRYETTRRDGGLWVSFRVASREGETVRLERKVQRVAKIKQTAGPSEERPVILLHVCIGDVSREVEVNLVDRSNFIYPMLVGRSFLAGNYVVDPSVKYTTEPRCVDAPHDP